MQSLPNLREIYFNYNEIEKKSTQKAIFEKCLELNLKTFEIKGNDINSKLWKEYKSRVRSKIENVTVYSDEEDSKKRLNQMMMNLKKRQRIQEKNQKRSWK